MYESPIIQINFYSCRETLVKVGGFKGTAKLAAKSRREVFEIDDDEQLIGCEFDYEKDRSCGVIWLKMKFASKYERFSTI